MPYASHQDCYQFSSEFHTHITSAGPFEIRELSWQDVPEAPGREASEEEALGAAYFIDRAALSSPRAHASIASSEPMSHQINPGTPPDSIEGGLQRWESQAAAVSDVDTQVSSGFDSSHAITTEDEGVGKSSEGSEGVSADRGDSAAGNVAQGVPGASGDDDGNWGSRDI